MTRTPPITELLKNKCQAHQACLAKPSCQKTRSEFVKMKSELQHKLRDMEDEWWDMKPEEIQRLADMGDSRGYYQALKAVFNHDGTQTSPLASDGTTLLPE